MPTFSLNHRHNIERTQQQRTLNEINPAPTTTNTAGATAGGDNTRLRGIPAIGRGVTGAINGTNPTTHLDNIRPNTHTTASTRRSPDALEAPGAAN